jgi:hypothetical protein
MNHHELNEQLLQTRQAIAERDHFQRALMRIERSLEEERATLRQMEESLRSEGEDVRRLERMSLSTLFYTLVGNRAERLEEERRELISAQIKYDQGRRRVQALLDDQLLTHRKISAAGDLDRRYKSLLDEKERLLLQSGRPDDGELAQLPVLSERLAETREMERELKEAIQAGEQAEQGLGRLVESLESASNWGTWDMLGGGMLVSAVKHSRLDDAGQAAEAVQPLLQRFERELGDVGASAGLSVERSGLMTFADLFIDGLLVDLMVQSRIHDSLDAARKMSRSTGELVARLKTRHTAAQREAQCLEAERRALLEQV